MAVITQLYNREEPEDHEYTEPIRCVICDAEWDADAHLGDWFKFHEDTEEPVCIEGCYAELSRELEGEMEDQDFELDAA